jgi:hypothetical protein
VGGSFTEFTERNFKVCQGISTNESAICVKLVYTKSATPKLPINPFKKKNSAS